MEIAPRPTLARGKHERWWWLVAFLIVSLLIHLGVGWESRGWHIMGTPSVSLATPSPGEIEVALGPLQRPATHKATKSTQAASTPAPAEPSAPPTHEAPSPEHNKRPSPIEAPKIPVRMDRKVSPEKTMAGDTMPTRNTPHTHTPDVQIPTPATPPPDQPQKPVALPTAKPVVAPIGLPDAPEQPLALPKVSGGAGTIDVGTIGPRARAPLANNPTGEKAVDQKGTEEKATPAGGPVEPVPRLPGHRVGLV